MWLAVPVRGKWRRQATKGVHLLQPKAGFVVLKPYSRLAGWEIQLIREILESKNFPPSPPGARLTPLNLALLDKKPYNLASLVGTFLDFKDR